MTPSAVAMDGLDALPRDFHARATERVARDLLGRYLVLRNPMDGPKVGRIVETEAYVGPHDLASHSSHGRTTRTAPMFEEPGHAYLYFIYGMHWCINVVTENVGQGCAVLLRAVEPKLGLAGTTNGPGKLCRAFGIDGRWNRADLTEGALTISAGQPVADDAVSVSPRIGVGYAGTWAEEPLRFLVTSSLCLSRYPTRAMLRA